MQRPTASCSTSMRQPWPAMPTPPMMRVQRHEHVAAADRAVLERDVERQVARADLDARRVARDQRAGDAEVGLAAEQALGIEHAERQADHGRHRGQRDVALGEVEPQTEHLAPLPRTAADHAGVGYRGGVRADARAGQREAGDFLAARQPWQVVVLLLLGAVVLQQFRRAERIRHRDRRGAGDAAPGELHQHAGVRISREAEPAVALVDDHGEEAARLQERPDRRRQVAAPVRDVEVVEHAAQLGAGAVDEVLLLGCQTRRRRAAQLRPVRDCR